MIEVKGKGGISAKIIADSINSNGDRIRTVQLRYHRYIHGELMTHRLFSRNAASSRAIPVKKMIEQVRTDPATPIHWGRNQPGMQANVELDAVRKEYAMLAWQQAANTAARKAEILLQADAHKQITNRILEPFQFMQTVVTATEWENFFNLRIHKDAQPEIQELASCMYEAMEKSRPVHMSDQCWHLPYVDIFSEFGSMKDEQLFISQEDFDNAIKCSAARCARVSYLNHDNSKPSIEKDLELYNMLATRPYDSGNGHVLGDDDPVHLSPLEHQATPMPHAMNDDERGWEDGITHADVNDNLWSANFKGWIQYRQLA
ncbi:MAG: FAD-dependent thymidylate synthase [Piscirickettsiaceae bacterium]|nr:FAD-dependent thymidylate synthase [Piscirickettsiaceae bacterium]